MTFKSVLKEVIEAFPANQTVKGANVESTLAKKGVKPEEFKFADMGIDPDKRYTKEELQQLEASRKDKFEMVELPENDNKSKYEWVSTKDELPYTTGNYRERVLTFNQGPKQAADFDRAQAEKEVQAALNTYDEAMRYWYPEGAEEQTALLKEVYDMDTEDEILDTLVSNGMDEPTAKAIYDDIVDGNSLDGIINRWVDGTASRFTSEDEANTAIAQVYDTIRRYKPDLDDSDDIVGINVDQILGPKPLTGAQYSELFDSIDIKADVHESVEALKAAGASEDAAWMLVNGKHVDGVNGKQDIVDRVMQYDEAAAKERVPSRYTSSHFAEQPNYLMHTRVYDADFDGVHTRVVDEIQSDLHQTGRQNGYSDERKPLNDRERKVLEEMRATDPREVSWDYSLLEELGVPSSDDTSEAMLRSAIDEMLETGTARTSYTGAVPTSPYEKTWLRKGIEQEISTAIDEGLEQIAFPVSGPMTEQLHRGKGVQKWYETQVVNTIKKVAKSIGATVEEKTLGGPKAIPDSTLAQLLPNLKADPKNYEKQALRVLGAWPDAVDAVMQHTDGKLTFKQLEDKLRTIGHRSENSLFSNPEYMTEFANLPRREQLTKLDELRKVLPASEVAVFAAITNGRYSIEEAMKQIQKLYAKDVFLVVKPKRELDADMRKTLADLDGHIAKHTEAGNTEQAEKLIKLRNQAQEDFSKPVKPSFTLYSSPIAGGFLVYQAIQAGHSEEQISAYLTNKGEDPEDVKEAITLGRKIEQAYAAGFSKEEIEAHLKAKETKITDVESVDPLEADKILHSLDHTWLPFGGKQYKTEGLPQELVNAEYTKRGMPIPSNEESFFTSAKDLGIRQEIVDSLVAKSEGFKRILDIEKPMAPGELIASLQVIYPNMTSVTSRTMGFFGDGTKAKATQAANEAARTHIINAAKEMGVTLIWDNGESNDPESLSTAMGIDGRWMVQREDGSTAPADPGFWESIKSEQFEIGGAVAGGIAGAKLGKSGHWSTAALSSVVGAVIGGVAGTNFDYMAQAIELNQQMNAETIVHKRLTAGEASVLGDMLAYPVVKSLGALGSGIVKAKDALVNGDSGRAYTALKENFHMTDEEVQDTLTALQRVADMPEGIQVTKPSAKFTPDGGIERAEDITVRMPMDKLMQEQGILATALTQPGGEELVRLASYLDPSVSRAVAKSVDQRARQIMESANNLTSKNIGRVLRQDLLNYTTDVKQNYRDVKAEAAKSPYLDSWAFDYTKLAIEPALTEMEKHIVDPPTLERFLRKAEVIRSRTDGRTFADLLDLRQLVNEFRFSKKMKKAVEQKAFKEVMENIDATVEQGAEVVLPGKHKQWLESWADARSQYAQMKDLEKNVLYKALTRDGIDAEQVTKTLSRYVTSLDSTWVDVMDRLPVAARSKAEGAVVNVLLNKYTAGVGAGDRAINFPLLQEELAKVSFTDPEARKFKAVINRLAPVFKNDVMLSKQHGNITIPKFQSFLTTDPVVRLQYEVASSVFNRFKQAAPTKKGRALALANKAADLLENPLNARTAKELLDEVGDSLNLAPKVLELQRAEALRRAKQKGEANPSILLYGPADNLKLSGEGTPTILHSTRIATPDLMDQIALAEGISRSDTKALDFALKARGYVAKTKGSDRVEMIK